MLGSFIGLRLMAEILHRILDLLPASHVHLHDLMTELTGEQAIGCCRHLLKLSDSDLLIHLAYVIHCTAPSYAAKKGHAIGSKYQNVRILGIFGDKLVVLQHALAIKLDRQVLQ